MYNIHIRAASHRTRTASRRAASRRAAFGHALRRPIRAVELLCDMILLAARQTSFAGRQRDSCWSAGKLAEPS